MNRLASTAVSASADPALIADFLAEWEQATRAAEAALIQIDALPQSAAGLNALFRVLHSMKSNLRMMQLDSGADLMHQLEDTLDAARRGALRFDHVHGDLILLLIDRVRAAALRQLDGDAVAWETLQTIHGALQQMHQEPDRSARHALSALACLDPSVVASDAPSAAEMEADLQFFRQLAQTAETRALLDAGATARSEQMALQMNALAADSIDAAQLSAAVALHDVGMALLPSSLIGKESALDPDQESQLRTHPMTAAELLAQLPRWAEAQRIVLQHHERFDGSGYPSGLSGAAIHPGARLLAIIDTFEAMTHKRAYREHKRPVLRAVAEINGKSGTQFDPYWVEVFNRWVRQHLLASRAAGNA